VAAEPVALYLQDGSVDDYGPIKNAAADILQVDSNDVLTS
jgi:hypothetical protein